jgi:uncharacterized protein involved in exopolysaccharide biosynthesis
MSDANPPAHEPLLQDGETPIGFLDLLVAGAENLKWLVGVPAVAAVVAVGLTYAEPPVYLSRAVVLPLGVRNAPFVQPHLFSMLSPSAQIGMQGEAFVNLMQSNAVVDRLVEEHGLQKAYGTGSVDDARTHLSARSRIDVNPKDGSISVEVNDVDPQRAAALANGYIRRAIDVAADLGLTEAQQRRIFFEAKLREAVAELADVRRELQSEGARPGSDRRAQSAQRTRLEAELRAAEISLQAIRPYLSDTSPQVVFANENIQSLKGELAALSSEADEAKSPSRRIAFLEALTPMLSRQYEAAQVDESRTGKLLHVIDEATVPDAPVGPKRLRRAVVAALGAAAAVIAILLLRSGWRGVVSDPHAQPKLRRLRAALSFRRAR